MSLDLSKLNEGLPLMELCANIVGYMSICTCIAHRQLEHVDCVHDPVARAVADWMDQQLPDLMKGSMPKEDFLQQLVLFTRDSTVTCLEEHVHDFDKTK